jgi:hypothetical protein
MTAMSNVEDFPQLTAEIRSGKSCRKVSTSNWRTFSATRCRSSKKRFAQPAGWDTRPYVVMWLLLLG